MAPFFRTAPLQYMLHTSQFCFPKGTLCFLTPFFCSVAGGVNASLNTNICNGTMRRDSGAAVDYCSAFFACSAGVHTSDACLSSFVCLRCSAWCETNTSIDVAAKICKNLKGIESILNILNHFTI